MSTKKTSTRLQRRQADFDAMRSEGSQGAKRKWVKTAGGKNQLFTRPGSNKK